MKDRVSTQPDSSTIPPGINSTRSNASPDFVKTPLLDRLLQCATRQTAPFHTPGHHGRGVSDRLQSVWGERIFAADLPELPELDNLFAPEDVIAEAQMLAAKTFGSERTFFLVNGSTAGVMAAILATCGPGEKILLPRTVHCSAISGLVLSGAQPVFAQPEVCGQTGLIGGLAARTVEQALLQHPDLKAVLLVSPTYEGVCGEVGAIARHCHGHGIPLLVDEAHGPHFGFHPKLPPSALSQGADLVVQSTHKVLSGLTQSAMLHLSSWVTTGTTKRPISPARVAQALQLVQSTSPSYLLLASLDAARMQMATQGAELMAQTLKLANDARTRLQSLTGLEVLELHTPKPGFAQLDPTRLTLDVSQLGLTGFEADEMLNESFGVIAELPSLRRLTFIISLGNSRTDIDRLVEGFAALATPTQAKTQCLSARTEAAATVATGSSPPSFPGTSLPATSLPATSLPTLSPRAAHFAQQRTLPAHQAIGHISAETLCPYPPGIPLLLPGEQITEEAIAQLRQVQTAGGRISGAHDPSLETIRIVDLSAVPE